MGTRLTRLVPAIAMLTAASVASAGPYDAAIEEVLQAAIEDWATVLSCSVLTPPEHEQFLEWWDEERAELPDLLAEAGFSAKLVADWMPRLEPAALMTMTEGTAADLIGFCAAAPDWKRQVAVFSITMPVNAIERLLRE